MSLIYMSDIYQANPDMVKFGVVTNAQSHNAHWALPSFLIIWGVHWENHRSAVSCQVWRWSGKGGEGVDTGARKCHVFAFFSSFSLYVGDNLYW